MQNRIVIFDLDGTIYQNSVFHRGYLRTLVAGTWAEPLEADPCPADRGDLRRA